MNKFGTVLASRQSGKEAYAAFQPTLAQMDPNENVIVDFVGVSSLSPSWADEFFTPLHATYGPRLLLRNTGNSSVSLTIETLETANDISFKQEKTS